MKTDLHILACVSRVVLLGDERAFEQIVRQYQEPLRRFFLAQTSGDGALADDLSQETFIRVWQRLDSFQRLSAFSTWLYQVAYRVWLDYLRSHKRELLELSFDDSPALEGQTERALQLDTLSQLAAEERRQWVMCSLGQMTEPGKTVLTLFYLQELSVRDISRIMTLSEVNVRAILSRGRRRLKQILEQTKDTL